MAGEAQNKLGELFVDLGVGGVGKTLKALNTVSATFLLTKNTAQQLIKPIVEMGKQSLNSAVEIGKLSASFGTTLIEAQKFAYYLKEKNLSEGLLGDMQNMQNKFTRIMAGFEGVDGQMAMSMNMLGLDWQNYDGSAESMMRYVKDVQNAVRGMETNQAKMHLQNLGLGNADWLYAFQRGDFDLNSALGIDEQTLLNMQEASENINELKNNLDQLQKNTVGKAVPWVNKNLLEPSNTYFDIKNRAKNSGKSPKATLEEKEKLRNFPGAKTTVKILKAWERFNKGKSGNELNAFQKMFYNGPTGQAAPKQIKGGKVVGEAAPIDLSYNPLSNLNTIPNQNIEITNQMTITGDNAQEIANEIASINSEQLQYNQYQSYNMAGV